MDIIIVSTLCSTTVYKRLILDSQRMGQQNQKFMRLLSEGLINNGASLSVYSTPPVNSRNCKKLVIRENADIENGINYSYISLLNVKVARNLCAFIGLFFRCLYKGIKDRETIFIVDLLNVTSSSATFLAARLTGTKIFGILTDMPLMYVGNENKKPTLHQRIAQHISSSFPDAYLFVSEEMNKVVNLKKRPYIVVEGFSDISMKSHMNTMNIKKKPKVIMYAGGLNRLYGLDILVEGFIEANLSGWELHLYGDGEYVPELIEICSHNQNVLYCGVKNNDEIVRLEEEATLLVNPRYTNSIFTLYSFPSKNMEYMASGTPLLTTCLPSMPNEYKKYVFLIDDETSSGVAKKLKEIGKMPDNELHDFGIRAKDYIIKEKNNNVATKKLINLLTRI